jgi:formylglycine-generating enzyme required for sulfatase activity
MRKFIYLVFVIILSLPACTPTVSTPTSNMVPELGSTRISETDGMVQVYVPAGVFEMGSEDGYEDEKPVHTVYLDAFWIDQTEITNEMFQTFIRDTGYVTDAESYGSSYVYLNNEWIEISGADWKHPEGSTSNLENLEDHPVVQVSWNDAMAYCEWAKRILPTEAQWEKAAKGTVASTYPWGNEFNCKNGNFDDESVLDEYVVAGLAGCDGYHTTAPVREYEGGVSPYEVYDMAGNVREWVMDWYDDKFYGEMSAAENNPQNSEESDYKTIRGGSWFDIEEGVRSTVRSYNAPYIADYIMGFRCSTSN